MKKWAMGLLLLVLLAAQPANAVSYPVTIPFGRSWPYSIVADQGRGLVYFDASSGDYPPTGYLFGVINASDHSVVATLPLDEVPGDMALDQSTGDVYVAGNYSIEVFRGTTILGMIDTSGHEIFGMAHDGTVSPNVYFTSGDGVFAIDPRTSALVGKATVANGPESLALDPANGMLYVSEYLSGEIAVLNASTLSQVATIKLPTCCASQLAVDPRTQTLFASTRTNAVFIIDAATQEFEKSVAVAPTPQNSTGPIAIDSSSGRAYVASAPGGSIVELEGSSGAVLRTFRAQGQVAGLAVDGQTHEIYATNYHQVTVFGTETVRYFRLIVLVAVAAAVVAVVFIYFILRRGDEKGRMRVQSGYTGALSSG